MGVLILVILTSSIYIMLPDKVRIDVQKTKTLISVFENDKWVLGATEFLNLFDGTTKMRAKSREVTNKTEGNLITITRTSKWKDNITTIHDYTFDFTISDVGLIPIEEKLYCYNCQGKIVHFEYRDILYDGLTREAISPESFGHNIKIEWQDGYEWAKVYQQKVASDKLIIRYKPKSDYEVYNVRLFDPIHGIRPIKVCKTEYYGISEEVWKNFSLKRTVCLNSTGLNTDCSEIDYIETRFMGMRTINKSREICRITGYIINGRYIKCEEIGAKCYRDTFSVIVKYPHCSSKDNPGCSENSGEWDCCEIIDMRDMSNRKSLNIKTEDVKIE